MNVAEWLIPKKNTIVRDPVTMAALSKEGELKDMIGPAGRYWRRRIKQGDVTIKITKPPVVKVEVASRSRKNKLT